MDFSITLVNLAGSVALLLWGVHVVQTGVQRALGARLKGLSNHMHVLEASDAPLARLAVEYSSITARTAGALAVSMGGIDTNTYISGLQFGGLPQVFLNHARAGGFRLAVSETSLAEIHDVLRLKFA
jgi:hypothetical protein